MTWKWLPMGVFGLVVGCLAVIAVDSRADPVALMLGFCATWMLFLTLLGVLHYAHVAEHHLGLLVGQHRVSHRPFVVTDQESGSYVARNIGPGLAVNVYMVVPIKGMDAPVIRQLGALRPGDQTPILGLEGEFERHVLFAEGLHSHTDQWTATVNAARKGRVFHRVGRLAYQNDDDPPRSIQEIIRREWTGLRIQIEEAARELFEQETQRFQS